MPKQEYELYLDALSARDRRAAGDIADGAHGRVLNVIDSIIKDKKTPSNARSVLQDVFLDFLDNKACARLDQAYSEQDQKRLVNRGV